MSFRSRVLDALDIHKTSVKLQVNETFPKIYSEQQVKKDDGSASVLQGSTEACTRENGVPYVVSKRLIDTKIGPNPVLGGSFKQTLDVLGFVVGKEVKEPTWQQTDDTTAGTITKYKNMYPITTSTSTTITAAAALLATAGTGPDANSRVPHAGGQDSIYTGFHYLNGIYDSESKELQHMRKSALPVLDMDTTLATNPHAHKDWPNNAIDQHHLLNENPYADALYYGSMKLSMLLTGISIPEVSEAASNHRGMVRMLILRPRLPSIKMRWDGVANQPHINMGYPPHWDTELFYSKRRTLGGRMDNSRLTNKSNDTVAASNGYLQHNVNHADEAHLTPTFGLLHRARAEPVIDNDPQSLHYGHRLPESELVPAVQDLEGDGSIGPDALGAVDGFKDHDFTSYDVLTAPINRSKYAVIVDKMVTLDTLHHGVASKRIENITIPFNKKIKFPGRKQGAAGSPNAISMLEDVTIDEPLNMESRPIIMFLSMDQKLSCQVTGYTTISEC